MNLGTVTFVIVVGILPALVWLAFWLREDVKNPEPRGFLLRTFLLGAFAVILVLPLEKLVDTLFPGGPLLAILLWVSLEEVLKYGAAYFGGLHSQAADEPIDPIIYMITAALGFVALENSLFILGPTFGEPLVSSITTGNLRFIGASLLHVVSSGLIGVALAFTFYQSKKRRAVFLLLALILAIVFHFSFNWAIISWKETGTLWAFLFVWIAVVGLLWSFERAKNIRP